MADDNYNKKVPKCDITWEYPWNQVTQTIGGHEFYINSTPNEESYSEYHPTGNYKQINKDGHKTELVSNKTYGLHSNGTTITHEGTVDTSSFGGIRDTNLGGFHSETGMDFTRGIYGQYLNVSKGIRTTYTDNEHHEISAQGATRDHNDGYAFNNSKEEAVDMTTDNRIVGTQGEYMSYNGGNWDTYMKKQGRLYAEDSFKLQTNNQLNILSRSDMVQSSNAKLDITSSDTMTVTGNSDVTITGKNSITITSDTKITIKVGSSKIEITSSGITIDAGSGSVTTQGTQTKIQGGGMMAPPTTFQ